ncbi:MAG TPA: BON domain-containing protein [Bryobacteraceae bacterium]|nr:BON domain-containing protein [Bryobacteraceae bacterium]
MKPTSAARFLMAAALLAGAGVAGAADKNQPPKFQTDADLGEAVRHEIVMYPRYTLFDDIYAQVENGQVRLTGVVTQPFKKSDIGKIVRQVAGDNRVANDIRVLPLSSVDERLRMQVARRIYSDPAMLRYAMNPVKPIHIIVENGHVTLSGIVATDFDKQIAGTRASSAMSFGQVVNHLRVENPARRS